MAATELIRGIAYGLAIRPFAPAEIWRSRSAAALFMSAGRLDGIVVRAEFGKDQIGQQEGLAAQSFRIVPKANNVFASQAVHGHPRPACSMLNDISDVDLSFEIH